MTDKLEPLPWFALNVGEYVKDTMRLTRDAHGAYFLLILDYYGTAKPCPDDDFILAALTKSTEAEWKQIRKMLAPFFDIRDGLWYHNRIEREMREASAKHAAGIAAAKVGAAARWEKERSAPRAPAATTHRNTVKLRKNAISNATAVPPAMPPAMPAQSDSYAHLHKHPLITGGGEAPPVEVDDLDSVGTPIPRDFLPSVENIEGAKAAGLAVAEIDAEVRKFIGTRQADGSFSHDWQGSFWVWIEREIAHRAKQAAKAPPRIEVNNTRQEPTESETARALALFAKGGPWSRHFGPEPGHIGCRVAPALIEAAGLDPKTGLKARKAS